MVPDSIERETVIHAPVDRVWELLTTAEHLGRWFGDAGAEIDLRPGGAMKLSWEEHGTVHARVEEVDPGRLFAYRWAASADQGETELVPANSTLVRFTLTAEGAATRLKVVESGFMALDGTEQDRADKVDDNTEGWQIKLGHLQDYTERVGV